MLDVKAELTHIRQMYEDDPRNYSYNALIYGSSGSGKTSLLRTARTPILVHSFDPGGGRVLRGDPPTYCPYDTSIDNGKIIVDSRFEHEDPNNPHVFELWDTEYHRLKRGKVFDKLGTFAIDSATTWAQCALNLILKRAGRKGGIPQQNDWLPQMVLMENALRGMLSLPCDFIFITHEDAEKDEASGRMFVGPLFTGKLRRRIPIMFDELYHAATSEKRSGIEYQLLTRATGLYLAKTRLGKGGELDTYEKPDIKHILKKVGLNAQDKPAIL